MRALHGREGAQVFPRFSLPLLRKREKSGISGRSQRGDTGPSRPAAIHEKRKNVSLRPAGRRLGGRCSGKEKARHRARRLSGGATGGGKKKGTGAARPVPCRGKGPPPGRRAFFRGYETAFVRMEAKRAAFSRMASHRPAAMSFLSASHVPPTQTTLGRDR